MHTLPLAGRRLLIAEDEAIQAMYLRSTLENAGATIVGSGASLKRTLELMETELDAAVLDVNLDGDFVFPVAEALAARAVPMVLHTAYVLQIDFAALGRVRVCQKPSTPEEIVEALCDVMQRPPGATFVESRPTA